MNNVSRRHLSAATIGLIVIFAGLVIPRAVFALPSASITVKFSVVSDTTPPISLVISPVNNSTYTTTGLTTISGTSFDSTSGINNVRVRIYRPIDAKYWDGSISDWTITETWNTATGTNNWSYSISSSAWTSGYYWVNSRSQDNAGNYESGFSTTVFYVTQPASKLVLVAPGETFNSGSPKSGSPIAQTAGVSFMVTVYSVDSSYYLVPTTVTVSINTSDNFDSEPAAKPLIAGSTTFALTLITAGNTQISANSVGLSSDTAIVSVVPDVATKLQILVPGETAVPGSSTGKSGTPINQVVGSTFTITVSGVDDYWNLSSAAVATVEIVSSGPISAVSPKPLVSGITTFDIVFNSTGAWSLVANDTDASPLNSSTSSVVSIILGAPPAAPSGFSGVSQSSTSIKWSWIDNATNEDGYRLKSDTNGIIVSLPANTTGYLETNLLVNTKYSRRVEVYSSAGASTTTLISVYTLANPPINLICPTKTFNSAQLIWSANSNPAGTLYKIIRSTDGIVYTSIAIISTTTYSDSGLVQLTTYYYKISALNGDGLATAAVEIIVITPESIVAGPIAGKVTQSDGTPITGVTVQLYDSGGTKLYEVYTSTDGSYQFANVADGVYKLVCIWVANDIESSVYKDSIPENSFDIWFTLEVKYQLAEVSGNIALIPKIRENIRRSVSRSNNSDLPYVELLQRGKVIARVYTDEQGNYVIPNLLPGKYSLQAYNGLQMSRPRDISVSEGSRLNVSFAWALGISDEDVYAYPNPTKIGSITIRYATPNPNHSAELKIYNIAAELVKSVNKDSFQQSGIVYKYDWQLDNDGGEKVASGVYIYLLKLKELSTGEEKVIKKKLAIIK